MNIEAHSAPFRQLPFAYRARTIFGLLLSACSLSPVAARAQSKLYLDALHKRMIEKEIIGGGIKNERVIQSMRATQRHEFVDAAHRKNAYYDMSLPIGAHQTISGPFVVAYMTEQLDPQPTDKVLEIGTGSGYQAAVLSPLVQDVYSIEIIEQLNKRATRTLDRLKYRNIHLKIGDGFQGWPEHAPFDKIIVTCSPEKVPQPLVDQLREGGNMIIPVGERFNQMLYRFTKRSGKLEKEPLRPTLFVPMTGTAEDGREVQPDPIHPQLVNGSFEEKIGTEGEPTAWYYCRLQEVKDVLDAPDGHRVLLFTNDVPGRMSRALQGFAIDGKQIGEVEVSASIRGKNIVHGPNAEQAPQISLTFYDANWAIIGRTWTGPYQGTFAWQLATEKLKVPRGATKCIMHVGLLGATGEFAIDNVKILAIPR
ncbi:MAG: protein-L-isoaspartate(D-aspartate) O-methyltransferase [Pirellulales bacterium]|nr:protein-L-isoaspartate(D-aspartate) O-methyltransferase [Pirellulales bacterium]